MNKIVALALFLFSSASLLAASTCETRVDKNPSSSTSERVQACLNEEIETSKEPQNHTVITEVYPVKYPAQKTKTQKSNKPTVTKKYKKQATNTEFLNQNQYPVFRNDTWPSISQEEVNDSALEAINKQTTAQTKNTKKPAVKKAKKSRRKMKSAPSVTPENAYPSVVTTQVPTVVPTQTPESDIAQAQALENNPMYQNNTDNGTAPNGFMEDGVMGPAGFGYNDTDPALQNY